VCAQPREEKREKRGLAGRKKKRLLGAAQKRKSDQVGKRRRRETEERDSSMNVIFVTTSGLCRQKSRGETLDGEKKDSWAFPTDRFLLFALWEEREEHSAKSREATSKLRKASASGET